MCGDANEPAFKKYGLDACKKIMYKTASKNGIEVINNWGN